MVENLNEFIKLKPKNKKLEYISDLEQGKGYKITLGDIKRGDTTFIKPRTIFYINLNNSLNKPTSIEITNKIINKLNLKSGSKVVIYLYKKGDVKIHYEYTLKLYGEYKPQLNKNINELLEVKIIDIRTTQKGIITIINFKHNSKLQEIRISTTKKEKLNLEVNKYIWVELDKNFYKFHLDLNIKKHGAFNINNNYVIYGYLVEWEEKISQFDNKYCLCKVRIFNSEIINICIYNYKFKFELLKKEMKIYLTKDTKSNMWVFNAKETIKNY